MTEDDLLKLVQAENDRAVGLENDADLSSDRERALQYIKGDISKDVQSLPNRSAVVSTDVSDAIETIMPDLMEMFTGGEDVASFAPRGPEDEEGAQQETDFLYHALFDLNDGFGNLYTGFKDALSVKTGVWTFWWDDDEFTEEQYEGSPVEFFTFQQQAQQMGAEIVEAQAQPPAEEGEEPVVKWTAKRIQKYGCAKFKAVPPEDFAVARDTVNLRDTTYCVMRSRPRAQDLIADGYDKAKVDMLPAYVQLSGEAVSSARDTASESEEANQGAANDDFRTVEILHHCLKVVEGDKPQYYSIVTDGECKVLLEKEKVSRVPFAAICPFPMAHRFYGRSLADLLIEIQKIKSVLWRMQLDSGYFALNQRPEISMQDATAETIEDFLLNTPGRPIRSKTGNALKYPPVGPLPFDVAGALEFASVAAEQRTGVVRNAQGLNPDTLHDTAKGQDQLMTMAQKRVRMIARIFAEGGLKDLFLGMHDLLRTHGGAQGRMARLRGRWVQVDPTTWGNRDDMTIEIGVGAGGREMEMLAIQGVIQLQTALAQNPATAHMVTPQNFYASSKKAIERSGLKNAEAYITDPEQTQPQQPPPDPKMIEAQAKMEIEKQKLALEQMKAQAEIELEREKAEAEVQLAREKMQMEAQLSVIRNQQQAATGQGSGVRFGGQVG